jgi:hypothetical protein
VSGSSGSGKTKSFNPVMRPVFEAQREIMARRAREVSIAKAGQMVCARKIRTLIGTGADSQDPNKIKAIMEEMAKLIDQKELLAARSGLPTLVCEDVTSERLAVLLSENNETLFSASSDAGQALSVLLGRYNRLRRWMRTIIRRSWI